jgi:3-oxoacyl-[acyl-carrier-protein] synthase III
VGELMLGNSVKVAGTGAYLPGKPVLFDDIHALLGELTEAPRQIQNWMKSMHSVMKEMLRVKQYYFAIDPRTREFTETNVTMAVKAARKALDDAGMQPNDMDLLLYACSSLEQMPAASTAIQEGLGIQQCGEISIQANCSSVYKAILLAHDLIAIGRYDTVMVVSSNMASSTARAEFYNQKLVKRDEIMLRWFLCDGAGCMIFTKDNSPSPKGTYLEAAYIESVGCGVAPMMFNKKRAYSMNPQEEYNQALHHVTQTRTNMRTDDDSGDSLIVNTFIAGLERMVAQCHIDLGKITLFNINFPAEHVNEAIMEKCIEKGIAAGAFYSKLDDYGYSGAPMALITMDKLLKEENLKANDQILSFVLEVSKIMQAGFLLKHY